MGPRGFHKLQGNLKEADSRGIYENFRWLWGHSRRVSRAFQKAIEWFLEFPGDSRSSQDDYREVSDSLGRLKPFQRSLKLVESVFL